MLAYTGNETFAVNTSDAAQTNITDLPVASGKCLMVWVHALVVKSGNTEAAYFQRRGMFFSDANGSLTQVYGQRLVDEQEMIKTAAALNWDIKLDLSQANVLKVNVRGAASSDLKWNISVEWIEQDYSVV